MLLTAVNLARGIRPQLLLNGSCRLSSIGKTILHALNGKAESGSSNVTTSFSRRSRDRVAHYVYANLKQESNHLRGVLIPIGTMTLTPERCCRCFQSEIRACRPENSRSQPEHQLEVALEP